MPDLCTKYENCDGYHKALASGASNCGGCGGDVTATQRLTRATDKALDYLVDYHNPTPQQFVKRLTEAVSMLCLEVEAIAADDPSVKLIENTEANLMLQIRGIETIQDLTEGIARGH